MEHDVVNNIIIKYNLKLINSVKGYSYIEEFSFYNVYFELLENHGGLFLRLHLTYPFREYTINWNKGKREFKRIIQNCLFIPLYKETDNLYEKVISSFIRSSLCSRKCIEEYYSLK
jgi:hypothetical protein